MLITLLPSEIARLVLSKRVLLHSCLEKFQFLLIYFVSQDYLDEEKYSNTYESFLNECRYLGKLLGFFLAAIHSILRLLFMNFILNQRNARSI